jgi:thioredoxin reductase (NADPH)
MAGEQVCVVGGQTQPVRPPCNWPNSPPGVTLLTRGESLAASMSDYLITQLKGDPSIGVRLRTRVAGGHGQARLEVLTLEDVRTGQREQVPAAAVLVMTGAETHTMAPRPRQAERSWIHPDRP